MRIPVVTFTLLLSIAGSLPAQPPERGPGGPPPGGREGGPGGMRGPGPGGPGPGGPGRGGPGGPFQQSAADPAAAVKRMFTLDANKDGKLSKDEVTDKRLAALGDRADANKDGNVTREELTALFTKEAAEANANRLQGGPGGRRRPPPNE